MAFFEAKIRPLFLERCVECHGEKKQKGGLRLDSRAGWQKGGDNGPAVVPGKADESLLIKAVRYTDDDLAMPPKKKGGKLGDSEISALDQWVAMGAPDPRNEAAATGPRLRSGKFVITDADRGYWAFQPVRRPDVPAVKAPHPIDAFVLAKLEEKGLAMNPLATPREQVRRAFFDLWGLPPSVEDVAAFEREPTDAAWAGLIDRLLASPHYGERWGRHWLDLVRFAESNGYERDGAKPDAWRYRDYVIASFNDDKPYDCFIREQLAGDELAEGLAPGREWRDAIIATGFFRLHIWDDEPDSTLVAEFDDLDDIMVTTGTAFLGLTIGCARCHDHKFDPISQADYYSLLSFFRSIDPYGQHKTGGGGRGTGKITRILAPSAEGRQWENAKRQRVKEIEQRLAAADAAAKLQIGDDLRRALEAVPPFDSALAVVENGPTPRATHVLSRGEVGSPREEVSPAFPVVLGLPPPTLPSRPPDALTTGRRRVLADWIASPQNPLTARVMMNRLWQRHFGVGIVPTPDDFGRTGLAPTNQALLDYLAAEFVAGGWCLKHMHRAIMTSAAYRMSSRAENPSALAVDESNTLLWRQNLRRVEAEVIRDTMLTVSGTLNPKQGGPSVFPTLPKEVHGTQDSAGKGWTDSPPDEQNRRSVYLVVKRALKIPLLESLDFANSTSPSGTRPVTTTAPQALMLLNDSFVHAQAAALAERVVREAGEQADAQVTRAFQLVLQRAPTESERQAVQSLLADQRQRAIAEGTAQPERGALKSFCRGLLNVNEMIYVE